MPTDYSTQETGMLPGDKWIIGSQCVGTDICGGGTPFCMNHSDLIRSNGKEPPRAELIRQPQTVTETNALIAAAEKCPVGVIHPPKQIE